MEASRAHQISPRHIRSRSRRRASIVAGLVALAAGASGESSGPQRSFETPLTRAPLDTMIVTGGFGEYRIGHFHAGLDLGTGGRVGWPVRAPLSGFVERVRASGVGYGRSIYLRGDDGRLLQFGHLDAFAEPLAAFVAAVQESSGQYEHDLWPEAGRFRYAAGAVIAWTGQSGAGGPHLHFEIRRGDMAYHPLRAGAIVADPRAPALANLTLEPLDDASYVAGGSAPKTISLGPAPETLTVQGRVRAVVGARDGVWRGVDRMVPWRIAATWRDERIECVFDSVSWATDMAEGDYVYDAGRVVGDKGMVLWAPAGFRPRVLRSNRSVSEEAGTILVQPGDPPRVLELEASDVAGNQTRRSIVLRGPARAGAAPDTNASGGSSGTGWRFRYQPLPGNFLRVVLRGAPAGSRRVWIERWIENVKIHASVTRAATFGPEGWTAILPVEPEGRPVRFSAWGQGPNGRWLQVGPLLALKPSPNASPVAPALKWRLPASARFENSPVYEEVGGTHPSAGGELSAAGAFLRLGPEALPLRAPLQIRALLPDSASDRVGLYRAGSDGWDWVPMGRDSATGERVGESRRLGTFALMRDGAAPRAKLLAAPRRAVTRPYPRWAVEASITEAGSGLDARSSYFRVDGKRVPVEWDSEARVLRWRPRQPPGRGTHRLEIVTADRAGNVGRVRTSLIVR